MKCGVNMHNCLYICQVALIGAHCKILKLHVMSEWRKLARILQQVKPTGKLNFLMASFYKMRIFLSVV